MRWCRRRPARVHLTCRTRTSEVPEPDHGNGRAPAGRRGVGEDSTVLRKHTARRSRASHAFPRAARLRSFRSSNPSRVGWVRCVLSLRARRLERHRDPPDDRLGNWSGTAAPGGTPPFDLTNQFGKPNSRHNPTSGISPHHAQSAWHPEMLILRIEISDELHVRSELNCCRKARRRHGFWRT